jgi:hypothetical protein
MRGKEGMGRDSLLERSYWVENSSYDPRKDKLSFGVTSFSFPQLQRQAY